MEKTISENDEVVGLEEEAQELEVETRGYTGPKLSFCGWILFAIITVFLALLIKLFLLQTFKIPSASMYPTLRVGDHIIVNKIAYGLRCPLISRPLIEGGDPKAGDVVVFQAWKSAVSEFESGNNYFIKRIVGVPGDTVEVHNYEVYVNGRKQPEVDFAVEDSFQDRQVERIKTYGPLKLAAGQYFVLGDNRSNSQDSRYYGPIDRADISGRAELVYWSWVRNQGSLDIAIGRIGLPIE